MDDSESSKKNGRASKQKNKKKLRGFSALKKNFQKGSKKQTTASAAVASPKLKHPQYSGDVEPAEHATSSRAASSRPPLKPAAPFSDESAGEQKFQHSLDVMNNRNESPSTSSDRGQDPTSSDRSQDPTSSDLAARVAAEMPEIDPRNVSDEQLLHLLLTSRKVAKRRNKIEEHHRGKMRDLFNEFEKKAVAIFDDFHVEAQPIDDALQTVVNPLVEVLEGKHVEVLATTFEKYTRYNPYKEYDLKRGIGRSNRGSNWSDGFRTYAGQSRFGGASSAPTSDASTSSSALNVATSAPGGDEEKAEPASLFDVRTSSRESRFLNFVFEERKRNKIETKRLQQRSKRKQKSEQKWKSRQRARRREMAEEQLLTIIPYLTTEQGVRALEINQDDIGRTVDWCLGQDQHTLLEKLDPHTNPLNRTLSELGVRDDDESESEDDFPPYSDPLAPFEVLSRQQTTGQLKRVVVKVEKVFPDSSVQVRLAMDRNRVPTDDIESKSFQVPLKKLLLKTEFRILSEGESTVVVTDRQERVLKITFQLIDNQLTPISVSPPEVRLNEYKIDFNTQQKTITNVWHKVDGAVRFRGVYDETGFGLIEQNIPIVVYSQTLNPLVHNIIHLCQLNDIRDDITFDMKNLTGATAEEEDRCYKEFKEDHFGRKLAYRIVVKDAKVVAVLTPIGSDVKRALFEEHAVPPVDSYVSLPRGRLGRVKRIPVSMLVAAKDNHGYELSHAEYDPTGLCEEKHAESLAGLVDCEILMDNDGQLASPPSRESICICHVKEAPPSKIDEYKTLRGKSEDSKLTEFQSKVAELESLVKITSKSIAADRNPRDVVARAQSLRAELYELTRQPSQEEPNSAASESDSGRFSREDLDRMERACRAVRGLTFELQHLQRTQ